VVYRKSIAPELKFETVMKRAGEDLVFFMHLAEAAKQICASNKTVTCGHGINIYFSNLDWNKKGNLRWLIDMINAHKII
jgi:hypothetical protein